MSFTWKKPSLPNSPADSHDSKTEAEKKAQKIAAKSRRKKPTAEVGGPKGLEPTRYGDWESAGRCIDF